ncbi:hypothetical protein TorRG33x02_049580, partial [Trema orientale]
MLKYYVKNAPHFISISATKVTSIAIPVRSTSSPEKNSFEIESGATIDIFWDLKSERFDTGLEPCAIFYMCATT